MRGHRTPNIVLILSIIGKVFLRARFRSGNDILVLVLGEIEVVEQLVSLECPSLS